MPMTRDMTRMLQELQRNLRQRYGARLKGLTLYGSQARGDAGEGSDVDVALILDDFAAAGDEISGFSDMASALSLEHGCVISILPIRERDWRTRQTPLFMNIRREGVALP